MTRFSAYGRYERAIAAADAGTMRQRWEYGRRLLCDPLATDRDGNLRPGVLDVLIHAARDRGVTLTEAEIAERLAAGKAYPQESQLRRVLDWFETWGDPLRGRVPGDRGGAGRGGVRPARGSRTGGGTGPSARVRRDRPRADDPVRLLPRRPV